MSKQNTHLEHLEDDILNDGAAGRKNAVAFLIELGKMLSEPRSNVRITTKWDGAPAVVCGKHPSTGNFFVATKSAFAQLPKICVNDADVDQYYSGDLAAKLKACLKYLPSLGIKGVVQGDLLFTDDKSNQVINKEKVISFQPNTIVYAVPADSDIGKRVKTAKLGIVFHTSYSGGPSLRNMSPSFGVDISKMRKNPNVMVFSSDFTDATGASTLSASELSAYTAQIRKTIGSLKQASSFLNILGETGEGKFLLSTLFKQFFNRYIREGKSITNTQKVASDFSIYYKELLDKEIQSKKTAKTQDKYRTIQANGLKFLKDNKRSVYFTVASYINLQQAKSIIVKKLEKVKTLGTFLRTESGYKVTAPEGFVAIRSGKALKLVDRLEFSRANFTATKNWDVKPAGYKPIGTK